MRVVIIPNVSEDLSIEQLMMLHAKTSRSRDSLSDRITCVKNSNTCEFFQKWIVDYKHESILEMGTLDIIIEDISHREALYLLMHPCLSAIESSTRYIDWTYKSQVDPFYKKVFSHLRELTKDRKDLHYLPFDVARGFISMDDLTCINLKASIRIIRSFIYELHSYAPIISDMIKAKLVELFPSLGIDQPPKHYINRIEIYDGIKLESQHMESKVLSGDYQSHKISIDYGCYRDLRRHRSLTHFCPTIRPSSMHPFYLHYLTQDLIDEYEQYIIRDNPVLLGMEVTVEFRGRWIDIDYMLETRRHSTSHPILRSICRSIIANRSRITNQYNSDDSTFSQDSLDISVSEDVCMYNIDYDNIGSNTRSQQETLYM
jgi:hypothetical protein